jgi:hypothetical protein
MNWKKTLIWTTLFVIFGLMLATAIVFLLASSPPDEYRPYKLNVLERKQVAEHFGTKLVNELLNGFEDVKPFTHTVKETELKQYLASLDMIANISDTQTSRGQRSKQLVEAMDKAGLADPDADFSPDGLTLMVRTVRSAKVISLDLSFEFVGEDRMKVNLDSVRIGRMPVPQFIVDRGLERFKSNLPAPPKDETPSLGDPKVLNNLLAYIFRSMGEEPVSTVIPFSKPKRVNRIDISDSELKIHFVPVERAED